MMLAAGDLDRLVKIQYPVHGEDEFGAGITSWQNLQTAPEVWASVDFLKGQELFLAQQTNAEVSVRFRLRWRDDIDETMRIVFDNKNYLIISVAEIGRRDGLEILAKNLEASVESGRQFNR